MKEWTSSMSKEETMAIIVKAQELESLGKKEDAAALRIKIPLHPGVADDVKRFNGIQWLIDGGFNLTDAVAAFGEKWLHE
ncbi:hypothetical protein [uncultured Fretibacterium sp.]|uniref:hypothetical protein n=1 Tax=uncultured Fretibacterium sp. TaxID=1678694 RepID=UPI0026234242|nr:hypothetical protein [uncultured Fretibacterium sp.]